MHAVGLPGIDASGAPATTNVSPLAGGYEVVRIAASAMLAGVGLRRDTFVRIMTDVVKVHPIWDWPITRDPHEPMSCPVNALLCIEVPPRRLAVAVFHEASAVHPAVGLLYSHPAHYSLDYFCGHSLVSHEAEYTTMEA